MSWLLVLIVPYGIETGYIRMLYALIEVLIVPYGIETNLNKSSLED